MAEGVDGAGRLQRPFRVRDYFDRLARIVEEQRVESVDVIDIDDERVIANVRGVGKTAHFDGEIEINWAWLITVKGWTRGHVVTFTARDQALEAARVQR